jgi:4-hydroxybenzoate polyprenyltransferase
LNTTSVMNQSALSRIKLFWALSRMTHGFLDMATPAAAALLCLGAIPSPKVIFLGFITAFAGYASVYALNDVVDYRVDKEKINMGRLQDSAGDLDGVYVRHPMAQGLLSYTEGVAWSLGWAVVALAGAYALNPACALIFVLGALLEVIYCLLLKISHLRTFVSGAVKTSGAMAAAFAVDPNPSWLFLIFLFTWLFSWEIGGQNVPNDWTDVEEDIEIQAKTIPVQLGSERSLQIIVVSLAVAVFLSLILYWVTPANLHPFYLLGAMAAGSLLLLIPAYRLYTERTPQLASALFNRSSYYPLTMLIVVLLSSMM